jgi:hypothetical protein
MSDICYKIVAQKPQVKQLQECYTERVASLTPDQSPRPTDKRSLRIELQRCGGEKA